MLNDKQIRFCEEYLKDYNGTQAAIRAGYSKKTASEQASRLLANVKIQEYLQKRKEKIADKVGVTQEQVVDELRRVAFSDLRALFKDDGSIKKIKDLDDDAARALAGVEVDEIKIGEGVVGISKKVKLWDKLKALEMLGKYFGIFEKDNEQKGDTTVIMV